MSIDLEHERLISLAEAQALLPGHPHLSTLWRWRKRGIGGVRLDTIRVGGRRFVSLKQLSGFIAAITDPQRSGAPEQSQGNATKSTIAKAESFLNREGV